MVTRLIAAQCHMGSNSVTGHSIYANMNMPVRDLLTPEGWMAKF